MAGDWQSLPVANLGTDQATPWWKTGLNLTRSLAIIALLPVIVYIWTNEKNTWIQVRGQACHVKSITDMVKGFGSK